MNSSVQNVLPVENVSSIDNASSVQETTLEGMLKAKYPNLKYHVFLMQAVVIGEQEMIIHIIYFIKMILIQKH